MFKNILVPIDVTHTEACARALEAVAKLADAGGAKLTLLNVIADIPNLVAVRLPEDFMDKTADAARAQLLEIATKCSLPAGSYDTVIRDGTPHHEILVEADERGSDLIVVGSHRPDLSDYLLGSVAARLVRHATCSVLVVRG